MPILSEDPTLTILDAAPALIWRAGTDGKCDWFNAAWLAFTGRAMAQEVGDGWTEGVHRDDFSRCLATYIEAFGRRQPFEMEYRLRRHDGQYRWIRDIGRPVFDGMARFTGYIGYCFDISEHRAMAEVLRNREQILQEAQQIGRMGHYLFDVVGDRWESSPMLDSIFGIDVSYRRDMVGWLALVVPEQRGELEEYWHSITERRENFDTEYRIIRPSDGSLRVVHGRGRMDYSSMGTPLRLLGTIQDITEDKQAAEGLTLAASVFKYSQQGIIITDPAGTIIDANPAFCRMSEYALDEILGGNPRLLKSGMQDDAFYRGMWATLARCGAWRGEIVNRKKSGALFPLMLEINTVKDSHGQVSHYVGMFSDIADLKQAQRRLEQLATHDALTGLPNRTLLGDRLSQAVSAARRNGRPLAVCFLDIDGFKAVNDSHGHEVGDRLLVQVAERLGRVTRAADTVCRLGGDEFVIVLVEFGGIGELGGVLERILGELRQPYDLGDQTKRLTASIGVTTFPDDDSEPDSLIRHADHAMYEAKSAGRDCWRMFAAAKIALP